MRRERSLWMRIPRSWLAPAVLLTAFAFAYWPVFRHWWHEWMRPGGYYSHGPIVLVIAAWVAFVRARASLRRPDEDPRHGRRSPALLGGALLGLGLLIYVVAIRIESNLVASYSALLVVLGAFAFIANRRPGWPMVAAVTVMGFAIPLPGFLCDELTFPLQTASTGMARAGLLVLGQRPEAYGTHLVMPRFELQVTTDCSGMKTALALLSLAALAALVVRAPPRKKALLFVAALPVALVLNAARLVLVGLAGNLWGERMGHAFHQWAAVALLIAAGLAAAAVFATWRRLLCRPAA